jgi:hypothetical protein
VAIPAGACALLNMMLTPRLPLLPFEHGSPLCSPGAASCRFPYGIVPFKYTHKAAPHAPIHTEHIDRRRMLC